jgi:hypothetical protein
MATVKSWSIFDTGFRRKFALCILAAVMLVFLILKIKTISESEITLEKYSGWNMDTLIASSKNERSLSLMSLNLFTSNSDKDDDDDDEEDGDSEANLRPQNGCNSQFNSPIGASYDFLIRQPFTLPDDYSRSLKEILAQDWVCDLQRFLKNIDEDKHIVNMIAANSNFTDPLLNWLIASFLRLEEPMIDVVVISLDEDLHNLLINRGIPSLMVTPDLMMRTEDFPDVYHMHNGFYQSRMMVMRLINHWGYDAANYDTDAVILHNPQVIYDDPDNADIDIFAGFAISFPPVLHKKWGATLCNGAWLVRSNPRTGKHKINIIQLCKILD